MLAAGLLLGLATGCPLGAGPGAGGDLPFIDDTVNSSFDNATALPLSPTDELSFQGRIDLPGDLDIFALGELSAGDHVLVDAQGTGLVDLVAAVFDSREFLNVYNDDRDPAGDDLDPLLDFTIRGQADEYFLGIAPYSGSAATGDYTVTVRIRRAGGDASSRPQVVFLNWAGGDDIVVPNVGVYDLDPFDAADLGSRFAGQTEAMKDRIQVIVEARYSGYDFTVLNSDDNARPQAPHSTVHFGGSHPRAFAISEQIDTFNEDQADDAIVFTETYRNAFLFPPTFDQMAEAIGNTVAHEVGHLLGLVHTHDCDSLMDSSCSNQAILVPQEFKTAELDDSVFPIGWQPAEEILGWVLGMIGM